MNPLKRYWIVLVVAVLGAFLVLGFFGREVYRQAPPIPEQVVTTSGKVLFDKEQIQRGQQVWQSIGGQQVGSVWGHGAYQAPDWSADWLHRESVALLDRLSQQRFGRAYDTLSAADQAAMRGALQEQMRTNTYDPSSGTVKVSDDRAAAMAEVGKHYDALFGDDPSLEALRSSYALQNGAVPDAGRRQDLQAFFFWTAWSCATNRPGQAVTYTNNWPHEPLIDNHPTGANLAWSVGSIALLILGIGALGAFKIFRKPEDDDLPTAPATDPLDGFRLTPSMKATGKYVAVVIAMFAIQVLLGALTAHYTVEGNGFFGLPIATLLPYAVTRTWHLQLAVFWIATSFLAAGLFLAPAVGGREPKFQRLGVNVLFGALVLVVGGSLAGEWLSVQHKLGLDLGFWFGHQGYEYVDLGRAWQIALYAGLGIWLALMLRGLWPALKTRDTMRPLVLLFAGSAGAIGLFYGAGLLYGARTHLSVMEYWRWWVVHLWVEGFMEVFATAALAFIFAKLGLVKRQSATRATILSTAVFLFAGIPGTFHHLYFSGTPVSIMAVGASFSALEVVPLALVGWEAWETWNRPIAARPCFHHPPRPRSRLPETPNQRCGSAVVCHQERRRCRLLVVVELGPVERHHDLGANAHHEADPSVHQAVPHHVAPAWEPVDPLDAALARDPSNLGVGLPDCVNAKDGGVGDAHNGVRQRLDALGVLGRAKDLVDEAPHTLGVHLRLEAVCRVGSRMGTRVLGLRYFAHGRKNSAVAHKLRAQQSDQGIPQVAVLSINASSCSAGLRLLSSSGRQCSRRTDCPGSWRAPPRTALALRRPSPP